MRHGTFVCPTCGEKLLMRAGAPKLMTAITILAALFFPFLAGARGPLLAMVAIASFVLLIVPVGFVMSFFIRPVLVLSRPARIAPGLTDKGH